MAARLLVVARVLVVLLLRLVWCADSHADTTRDSATQLYNQVYLGSNGISQQWTGNIDAGNPGTVSGAYLTAVLQRINYFRVMTGLPGTVSFRPDLNQSCAQAALMFSANNDLSHMPPSSWRFYTSAGAQAAGHSDIAFGIAGPSAINAFISDSGLTSLGHRRWILFPPQLQMGAGMVFPDQNYYPAMALWVIGSTADGSWSSTRPASPPFVAWPPPGYVPYQVTYPLWSFSVPNADFSSAILSVIKSGVTLPVTTYPQANGYGDTTLVWQPADQPIGAVTTDVSYVVQITNVRVSGVSRNYSYTVTVFDPTSTPVCSADSNGDHVVNNTDLFAYLNSFLSNSLQADFDHSGVVNITDIEGFMRAWFAGC